MSLLRSFININRRLSSYLDRRGDAMLYARYDDEVARAIEALPVGGIIADVGGGRACSFVDHVPEDRNLTVVAVDVSAEELAANTSVHMKLIADVSREIPLPDRKIDLLVSRTLLEHVSDVRGAAESMARVLKPGGQTLHLLPCRYALFAVIARVLPFALAKRALHTVIPESKGVVEFDVFYDQGHPRALERAFRQAGFREVTVECTWDQTAYFHAFFPAFVLVLVYQRMVEAFNLRLLASYAIVRAVR
jgi:ubiquinone/menaquinone biosynthesis C-methylase UbiE